MGVEAATNWEGCHISNRGCGSSSKGVVGLSRTLYIYHMKRKNNAKTRQRSRERKKKEIFAPYKQTTTVKHDFNR